MESTMAKKVSGGNLIAIFAFMFVGLGTTVVTPAMAKFAEAFPNNNFVLISTMPSLFMVAGILLAGITVGKKLSYKQTALIGSLLYLIAGCAPAFISDFNFILVCRALLGFGIGLLQPLANALIVGLFKGQKQASLLGYGTLITNAGGIILQMLGGIFADISWQMTFWAHIVSIIAVVMSFFLPELPKAEMPVNKAFVQKEKVGKVVWVIAFMMLFLCMLNFPVMMNISILFDMRNAGGATAAATAVSLFTAAGCVAGLVFGSIFKYAKRFSLSLGFFIAALGSVLVRFGNDGVLMTLGLAMNGFGFSLTLPALFTWMGLSTPQSMVALSTSIILTFMSIGGFISTYWLILLKTIFGENVLSGIVISIIFFALISVVFLIFNAFKNAGRPAPAAD